MTNYRDKTTKEWKAAEAERRRKIGIASKDHWAKKRGGPLEVEVLRARVSFLSNLCIRAVVEGWTETRILEELTK